jgi:hypothetical protein
MANRVPLVVANQKMREIANGDTLDLTGNKLIVGGDLTPSSNSVYDLGDSSKKWKDLHLSGSTIHLGTILLQDSGGQLVTKDSASGPTTSLGLGANTTDNLTEGSTNLYFTNTRADARVAAALATDVIVGGDLTVNGTTTTINSTTLTVDDKNIVLSSGGNTAAANGAGITIDGANATMLYNSSSHRFDFNKGITTNDSSVFGGNGSSSGITLDDGQVSIRTGTGSVAYIDLYCETGNAHKVRVQSPGHSQYSGNVTVKLPAEDGTVATVGVDSADVLLIINAAGTTVKTIRGAGNSAL